MVKKIRVIENDDDTSTSTIDTKDIDLKELAKSMDWKLWEMLQTLQRLEKKLTVLGSDDDGTTT